MEDTTEYSTCPQESRKWFYMFFAPCFAKKYIDPDDKKYYHKVLWFKYTTDGRKCEGLYWNPEEVSPYDIEVFRPDVWFFCALTFRWIRINICCDKD